MSAVRALAAAALAVATHSAATDPLPPPSARETIPGVDVIYTDAAVPNGDRVRVIVTRPSGTSARLPAVFVVGWLSCDSVSWPTGPSFGLAHAIDRTPGEVLRRHPDWKPLWNDANDGQYGRPSAFFQQLQRLNLAEAWSGVRAPTLVVHGERDWIMSADDHRIIARIVDWLREQAKR